ncbi:MAG: hypothetical protein HQQ73_10605 [Desulfobulbaceae bacterium]|nr:hypothetical protein [Desulfobulbaceae bacterium]
MSHHIFAVPFLGAHPAGWLVLGAAGYLAYTAGKKAGQEKNDQLEQPTLGDRTIKNAMKTAYKAKMKADRALASVKDKYGSMWQEAQAEASGQTRAQ